jgi:hypothetical protein
MKTFLKIVGIFIISLIVVSIFTLLLLGPVVMYVTTKSPIWLCGYLLYVSLYFTFTYIDENTDIDLRF